MKHGEQGLENHDRINIYDSTMPQWLWNAYKSSVKAEMNPGDFPVKPKALHDRAPSGRAFPAHQRPGSAIQTIEQRRLKHIFITTKHKRSVGTSC